ncbi:PLP-dependent aminotransferase family protein [Natronococcus sp. A-GB7]|uniref:aminotransferase-like domain-containing protein n=1 Tax=Natronococcus sp. A-GB7 TaxID=3037649 RepID=UPI00241E34A8|nr:PLP-dependent aminotransferase family protein [Natronococcus sp. A-GB7]MDG5820755.1 PLP-dependent aminotransferase family protein [Natronococcus sp. A-GB7]
MQDQIGSTGYGDWRLVSASDAVSLGYGFPYPSSLPSDDLVTVTEAVLADEGEHVLQYGGGSYTEQLTDFLVERAQSSDIDCDPSNILLTNGGTRAIDVVCRAFLEPSDSLIVEGPTFMGAISVFRNHGVEIDSFDVDTDGLDVDAVAEELRTREREGREIPKLLYTIPNFQNPTGVTLSLDRRNRLLELADEYDFVLIEDDAYGDLRYTEHELPTLKALDDTGRVVRIGTFSKTIAPGVRTGWIIANNEIVEALRKLNAGGTNTFTRSLVAHYCTTGKLDEHIEELRDVYEERRDRILHALETHMPPAAEWTEPEGGFFVWVTLPIHIDTEEMLHDAAENGVTYLPGSMFFPTDEGSNSLRLSFSYVPLDELERGIAALGRTVRERL